MPHAFVEAKPSTFAQLFTNKYYEVPKFQRSFSWKREHVNDFWEDLSEVIRLARPHFFGSIVLQRDGEAGKSSIYDGQQRLTVVVALISLIRVELLELSQGDVNNEVIRELILKTQKYMYDKHGKPYLQLAEYNREVFKDYLLGNPEELIDRKYRTNEFLRECVFRNLRAKIKEDLKSRQAADEKMDYLKTLLETTTNRVYFVVVYVDRHFSAATLFETLNFRGATLNVSDLLKSLIFSKAKEQRCVGEVGELWKENIEAVDLHKMSLAEFLKHFRVCQTGKLVEGSLYKALKRDFENPNTRVLDYMKQINRSLRLYVDLVKPKNKVRWSRDRGIERCLLAINRMGAKEPLPLLLALFSLPEGKNGDSADMNKLRRKLLIAIENVSFRLSVCKRIAPHDLEKLYAEFSQRIRQDTIGALETLIRKIHSLAPEDRIFEQEFCNYTSPSNWLSQYILHRLERSSLGRREPITEETSEVTIEHIMPKTLSHGWAGVSKYHRDYLNRIGNLTLISKKLNITNASFKRKKDRYYANSNVSLTKALVAYPKWRKKEIIARQKDLAQQAISVWGLN